MVDIHSHIMFGVDDGSRDAAMSAEMLAMAAASGTTDIVATPHASPQYEFRPEVNAERLAIMRAQSPAPNIHTGCDFHLSFENVQDAMHNPKKYTINGLNYLLVEFADGALFPNTEEILERLRNAGTVPIITHPERSWVLQQHLEKMEEWVAAGSLIQVTAGSMTGRFGKVSLKFAEELIDKGICHFIASDAHDPMDRHTRLDKAYKVVEKKWGGEMAQKLFVDNGRIVITGGFEEEIRMLPKPKKRWFFF